MFFVNHREYESSDADGSSKMNLHEASFIVALCKYLIQQGYAATRVTILATYKTQLKKIKQLLSKETLLGEIHATTVDNFQGEENDIILVSFVRSNVDRIIGFLRAPNRVNVALSRAKMGLYCIGNFEYMAERCKRANDYNFPWDKLVRKLKERNEIGDALQICCQIHGTASMVKTEDDFLKMAPNGGCSIVCNNDLGCGHICSRACHTLNKDSEHIKMRQACVEPCKKKLQCGHNCSKSCREVCAKICSEMVVTKSRCGHDVFIKCSDASNDSKSSDACTEPCDTELKCGHRCKGSCGRCQFGRLHTSCQEKCTRTLTCDHLCPKECQHDEEDNVSPDDMKKLKIEFASVRNIYKQKAYFRDAFWKIREEFQMNDVIVIQSYSEYTLIERKFHFWKKILEIVNSTSVQNFFYNNRWSPKTLERFDERIRIVVSFILDFENCEQQRDDISTEIAILKLMAVAIRNAVAWMKEEQAI